jgi:hypothetical protein
MIRTWLTRLTPAKALILVGLLAMAAYGRTVGFGFVWDDTHFVVRNPAVQSWSAIPSWFVDATAYAAPGVDAPMFRPVRNLSYLLDWSVAGARPAWFHLVNVVLHGLNAALLCGLLMVLLTRARGADEGQEGGVAPTAIGAAVLGALMWAWHPVQTESVAWIKSRDELLYALFLFLAGLSLFHAVTRPVAAWTGFVGAFGLALLSKESAVVLPAILGLGWVLWRGTTGGRTLGWATVVSGLMALSFLVWRHGVLGRTEQTGRLSGSAWLDGLTTLGVVWEYVRLTLVPLRQSADYHGYPLVLSAWSARALGGLSLSLGLVAAALGLVRSGRREARLAAAGLLSVPLSLLPVLNIVPMMQYLAERFLYLPLAGVALVTAVLLRLAGPRVWWGAAVWAVLLLSLTLMRQGVWESDRTLFAANWRDGYRTGRNAQNYASVLIAENRLAEAAGLLYALVGPEQPFGPPPNLALAHQGYGNVLYRLGDTDGALTHTLEAIRLNPQQPDALLTLGIIRGNGGDHAAALEAFTSATLAAPGDPTARAYRDQARGMVGGE